MAVNQELRITFTNPVDPLTVTNNTFRLLEDTGRTPAGGFALDPLDPRTLIYRPQLTFDSAGNPVFGLTEDKMYLFTIPGSLRDAPPYIQSTSGEANSSSLVCTLNATEGVRDANPGRPRMTAFVFLKDDDGDDTDGDIVRVGEDINGIPIPGEPIGGPKLFNAIGATRVHRNSPVRFVFDDVMNPATLANPVTAESDFIHGFVDPDGDPTDRSDQVPMLGEFTVTLDQALHRTTVVFIPSSGLPSAGSDDDHPRRVVLELSPQIADLGGNTLVNAGTFSLTPEKIVFAQETIEESFADLAREDALRTGSSWGTGLLFTGPGGGSGRLGDLVVLPGTVVELDTDEEDFSGITNPAMFNPVHIIDRDNALPITNGVFEFSRLRVDAGGVLRFKGSNPARVYVRGVADIAGLIDASGAGGVLHTSDLKEGGVGGVPGPNGGAGGDGGDRPDGSRFTGTFFGAPIGGVANVPAGPSNVLDPATYQFVNGLPGGGIPYPSTIDPSPIFVAGGQSGLGWPQPTVDHPELHMPRDVTDVSGLQYEVMSDCAYPIPSSPGGGGAHALDGGVGDMTLVPMSPFPIPTDSPGGDSDELHIDDLVRTLSPELGLLRGGAGGGGAGGHVQRTKVNGKLRDSCSIGVPQGTPIQIIEHVAHSSAGGGGGGGGIQLAAGRRVILSGVLDASGGDGGSGTFPPDSATPNDLAQAGGGGAGGSVLLQSQRVQIQAVPGRINVSGGVGGEGSGNPIGPFRPSTGGLGSPGFVRLETPTPLDVDNEQAKVNPNEATLKAQYGMSLTIDAIMTSAVWQPATEVPSGFSGAQSCWIRPTGNFFRLLFRDDAGVPCEEGHTGDELGWDMRLRFTGQAEPQSFRGMNNLSGIPLEQLFGAEFGTSPVVVRFQGARAVGILNDPCAVPEVGSSSPLSAASITEWVCHPALLNDFHPEESLAPNMFRFLVLWDRSQMDIAGIEGVEDITITIQPD